MSETAAMYLDELLRQKSLQVAKTRNAAGYGVMFPEAVRETLARYPSLSPVEKDILRAKIEAYVQGICETTKSDPHQYTMALREAARILGS